jgi:hypothetical protein
MGTGLADFISQRPTLSPFLPWCLLWCASSLAPVLTGMVLKRIGKQTAGQSGPYNHLSLARRSKHKEVSI